MKTGPRPDPLGPIRVAKRAGVSATTVRRYFAGGKLHGGTRLLIEQALREMSAEQTPETGTADDQGGTSHGD